MAAATQALPLHDKRKYGGKSSGLGPVEYRCRHKGIQGKSAPQHPRSIGRSSLFLRLMGSHTQSHGCDTF